jgi:phosphoserine phosphatase RsbU/P
MISALDELVAVVRCIEAGAEDYLPKPCEPTLLRARIGAGLEKKMFRDQEQNYLHTIEQTQRRLSSELDEAANYVRSILPEPVAEPVAIDWRYVPSTELGGDSFGYHWMDDGHLAIYLLDVCGHGVGASLLAVTAINVIRSGSLANVDFRDPSAVLDALNEAFPMEKQNNMYFTIWYGVYSRNERVIRYASAGHPPPIFLPAGNKPPAPLSGGGLMIGAMPGIRYKSMFLPTGEGGELVVVSDGVYELKTREGAMLGYEDLEKFLAAGDSAGSVLDRLVERAHATKGEEALDDDFSALTVRL